MSGPPKRLGEGVGRLLRDLGAPTAGTIEVLAERWPEVVGPVLAASTRPAGVRDGRLVVAADDPGAASKVRWSQRSLIDAIDRLVEPGAVSAIEVRVRRAEAP